MSNPTPQGSLTPAPQGSLTPTPQGSLTPVPSSPGPEQTPAPTPVGGDCLAPNQICDGGCISVLVSLSHCGTCNNACSGNQSCINGFCQDSSVPTPTPTATPNGTPGTPTPTPPASGGNGGGGATPTPEETPAGGGGGGGDNVGGMGGIGATPTPEETPTETPTPEPTPIMPSVFGQDYMLNLDGFSFVANGPTGRGTQLIIDGANFLTDTTVNNLNYGSSFWTSPQNDWGWPPPHDAQTYTHAIEGDSVLFTSPNFSLPSSGATISITKRFSADAARNLIVQEFVIFNRGGSAISVAPWQITRVRPQGFTFYPTGSSASQSQIPTSAIDGVTWLNYAGGGINNGTKNIADGAEGWLAHVNNGILFLKIFPDIPANQQAPGEGEIEIYIDSLSTYVELEPQGAYAAIPAGGQSPPWQVQWLVRSVPSEVQVAAGSSSLVQWVRGIVAGL